VEEVGSHQAKPPPPPLLAEQAFSHSIRSPCCRDHESEDGRDLGPVPAPQLRHHFRRQRSQRHRQLERQGLKESGSPQVRGQNGRLPARLLPSSAPLEELSDPCHAPQKSPNTSCERVLAVGVSGGLEAGRMFRPTSSGSTGPDTAPGLSGGSGGGGAVGASGDGRGFSGWSAGAIFIRASFPGRRRLGLAALRRDFAAHPLPPVLVLTEKHRQTDLDGFPEDMSLGIPCRARKLPNSIHPLLGETHRDLFPLGLQERRHGGNCHTLPHPVISVFSLPLPRPPRRILLPPSCDFLSLSHP